MTVLFGVNSWDFSPRRCPEDRQPDGPRTKAGDIPLFHDNDATAPHPQPRCARSSDVCAVLDSHSERQVTHDRIDRFCIGCAVRSHSDRVVVGLIRSVSADDGRNPLSASIVSVLVFPPRDAGIDHPGLSWNRCRGPDYPLCNRINKLSL